MQSLNQSQVRSGIDPRNIIAPTPNFWVRVSENNPNIFKINAALGEHLPNQDDGSIPELAKATKQSLVEHAYAPLDMETSYYLQLTNLVRGELFPMSKGGKFYVPIRFLSTFGIKGIDWEYLGPQ